MLASLNHLIPWTHDFNIQRKESSVASEGQSDRKSAPWCTARLVTSPFVLLYRVSHLTCQTISGVLSRFYDQSLWNCQLDEDRVWSEHFDSINIASHLTFGRGIHKPTPKICIGFRWLKKEISTALCRVAVWVCQAGVFLFFFPHVFSLFFSVRGDTILFKEIYSSFSLLGAGWKLIILSYKLYPFKSSIICCGCYNVRSEGWQKSCDALDGLRIGRRDWFKGKQRKISTIHQLDGISPPSPSPSPMHC